MHVPGERGQGMAEQRRPGVRMDPAEAWAFLREGHTGIYTTLRRDGMPVSLPVWYAVDGEAVYVSTRGKKVLRVRHNPASSFLVEAGQAWAELRGVHLTGRSSVVDPDEALRARITAELDRKYAAFRTSRSRMPDATKAYYSAGQAIIMFEPDPRILSWDNRRLDIA